MSFFEIFQPGLKNQREEQDRQKSLVTYPTHGGGGPLGIDLAGGKATIKMPSKPAVPVEPDAPDTDATDLGRADDNPAAPGPVDPPAPTGQAPR